MDTTTKYVGIDVHQATVVIVVLLASGEMMSSTVASTTHEAVTQFFRGLRGRVHVALEEGAQAQWLHDILSPMVERVVVANERGKAKGNKADALDARELANRLRLNALKPVYHQVGSVAVLKQLVRSYESIVEDRTRLKLRLKALFRSEAIAVPGDSVYNPKVADKRIQELRKKRKVMTRGLNRNHSPELKNVFMTAANDAACRKGPLREYYAGLIGRGIRPEMAKLTLARKIAAYTLRIWKKGERFDRAKLTSVPTMIESRKR